MGYESKRTGKNGESYEIKQSTDWGPAIFIAFVLICIILTSGSPDLLDAIGDRVSGRNQCQNEEVLKTLLEERNNITNARSNGHSGK